MTLTNTNTRMDYTGNGATSTYAYTFRIFEDSDLVVTVTAPDETTYTLNLDDDYTVTGMGSSSGGNIVLVNDGQAWLDSGSLKSSYALVIKRQLPLTQRTDLRNQGSFYPEDHENQFDRLVMIAQQLKENIDQVEDDLLAMIADTLNLTFPDPIEAASFIPTGSTPPEDGMYLPATNTLGFTTNAIDRITVGSDGKTSVLAQAVSHELLGGHRYQVRSITSNTTLDTTTSDHIVLVDSSGGAVTVTLPAATSGRNLIIKDSGGAAGTNNITIQRAGGATIDGSTSIVMSANYQSLSFVSNGTNWFIV